MAAPEQRVSIEQALRGVTIEAAYSLKLEDEVGTISPGKRANFTVLADNPLTADPMTIKDIAVWGTVMEGQSATRGPGAEEGRTCTIFTGREGRLSARGAAPRPHGGAWPGVRRERNFQRPDDLSCIAQQDYLYRPHRILA